MTEEVVVAWAEIYRSDDGWRFRLRGGNGEIVATGESYTHRRDCEAAIRALVAEDVQIRDVEA